MIDLEMRIKRVTSLLDRRAIAPLAKFIPRKEITVYSRTVCSAFGSDSGCLGREEQPSI
jgi:hypothetical protein